MSHSPVKAVAFDFGGVLGLVDPLKNSRDIARYCDRSLEEIHAIVTGELHHQFEEGIIGPEEFWQAAMRALDAPMPYETFAASWNGAVSANRSSTVMVFSSQVSLATNFQRSEICRASVCRWGSRVNQVFSL